MNGKIPESAKMNLCGSIKYTIDFSRTLLKNNKNDFVCENIIQLLRDIYLYEKGVRLEDNAAGAIKGLCLNMTDAEINVINLIERSMRNEEYYKKTCSYINSDILNSILIKLENFMLKI
jgi:hypothetical protein